MYTNIPKMLDQLMVIGEWMLMMVFGLKTLLRLRLFMYY